MDDFKKELEDYFCRFTFGQFVTLILLEIVTLFFVFYLGARYGPDLIGGRSSQSRTAGGLSPDLPKDQPSRVDEIVGPSPVDYTYPEVLSGSGGDKAIRVKPSGLTAEEYEKRRRDLPESPQEIKEPENSVATAAAEIPKGKYTVQVGSYQSAEEASALVKGWKGKGYSSFMSVGQIPQKGTWYRVRIGGFPTREKAEDFLEKFKVKEKTAGLVVLSSS